MPKLTRLAVAVGCLFVLAALGQDSPPRPMRVSLVQLIATPEKFDGKMVTVEGFLDMDREGDLLYLHQADSENVILSNAIWVRRTEQMGRDKAKLSRRYVKVTGTFRLGFKEQLGTPGSGITEVQSVEFWSDPAHPMTQRIRQIPGVSSNP